MRLEALRRARADAGQGAHVQVREERRFRSRLNHDESSGLARFAGDLGDHLVAGDSHGAWESEVDTDPSLHPVGADGGLLRVLRYGREVDVSLVYGHLLDDAGLALEDVHHTSGVFAIELEARPKDDRFRTEAHRA